MGFVHIEAGCFDSNIYRMSESSQEKRISHSHKYGIKSKTTMLVHYRATFWLEVYNILLCYLFIVIYGWCKENRYISLIHTCTL